MNDKAQVAWTFVVAADERVFTRTEAADFFKKVGMSAEFMNINVVDRTPTSADGLEDFLIVVHQGGKGAVGIPPLRVGMRCVDLEKFFDTHNYSGVDPIQARHINRLPVLHRDSKDSEEWVVAEKGAINCQ